MRTVLLAYEREQDLSKVETLLKTRGHHVLRARTGVEALEIARSESPEIIVSDVLLPRLDGFALCRRIKEDPFLQHVPVLLHSFRVEGPKYEAFAAEVSAEQFLARGATLEELVAAVDAQKPGSGTMRMPAVMPELLEGRERDRERLADLEQRLRVAEAANQQFAADEKAARESAEREAEQRAEAAKADAEALEALKVRVAELEAEQKQLSAAEKQARGVVAESQAGLARVSLLEKRLTELQAGRAKAQAIAEDALRVFTAQPLPTWLCDMDTAELRAASETAAALVGSSVDKLLKRPLSEILPGVDLKSDPAQVAILSLARPGNDSVRLEVRRHSVSFGGRACWLLTTTDVTGQHADDERRAEQVLKVQAIEQSPTPCSVLDVDGKFIFANDAFAGLFGVAGEALAGRSLRDFDVDSDLDSTAATVSVGGDGFTAQRGRWRRPDGTVFDVEISSSPFDERQGFRVLSARDVSTQHHHAALFEREQQCLLALLAQAQQAHASTDNEITGQAVELANLMTGSENAAFFLVPPEGSELELCALTADPSEGSAGDRRWRGAPPSSSALQECLESAKVLVRETEEGSGALKEAGLPATLTRQLLVPVLDGTRRVAAVLLLAGKTDAYDDNDCRLATLVADSAWQALRRRRSNAEVLSAMDHMERVMLGSIEALGNLAEVQDGCKRGRTRRVSELAAGLGGALGLPGHTVRGLRVVGQLLDVGMLQIPKEILWRPGELTDAEYALVKSHVDHGYESLRRIEFPWPVAEAVRQHHECVDGSGYPQGLSGEEILLEARIVAVADAVDAMLSPRPQRDALSLRACLEELQLQAGRRYDARVVKACVRLLQEREAKAEGEVTRSQIA